jgi:hypothetical protein
VPSARCDELVRSLAEAVGEHLDAPGSVADDHR